MGEHTDLHLGQSDAFTWYMERDPLLRSTVVVVMLLDRPPDPHRVAARSSAATGMVLGACHHLVEAPGRIAPPRWVPDPNFDLSFHVRRIKVASPKNIDAVLEIARNIAMEGFDTARPLWSWTTVEGLEHGRAAGILKVHHSLDRRHRRDAARDGAVRRGARRSRSRARSRTRSG